MPAVTEAAAPIVEFEPRTWVLHFDAPVTTVKDRKTKQKKLVAAWLSMNNRRHHQAQARIVKEWRILVATYALQQRLPKGEVTRGRFDVEVQAAGGTRRDPSNWQSTAKAIVDALMAGTKTKPGYGFLPDDTPKYLCCDACPHVTIADELLPARPYGPFGKVTVTITDLSGIPASRIWTPRRQTATGTQVTVKRACNGCSRLLGDVTDPEIQAAMSGLPLPDVRAECPTCTPTPTPARRGTTRTRKAQ